MRPWNDHIKRGEVHDVAFCDALNAQEHLASRYGFPLRDALLDRRRFGLMGNASVSGGHHGPGYQEHEHQEGFAHLQEGAGCGHRLWSLLEWGRPKPPPVRLESRDVPFFSDGFHIRAFIHHHISHGLEDTTEAGLPVVYIDDVGHIEGVRGRLKHFEVPPVFVFAEGANEGVFRGGEHRELRGWWACENDIGAIH